MESQKERVGYVFVHLFQLYFYALLHRTQEVRDFSPITNSLAQWTLVDGGQSAVTMNIYLTMFLLRKRRTEKWVFLSKSDIFLKKQNKTCITDM